MSSVPVQMSPEEFDALVDAALDEIPEEIARLVHNVVVLIEDEPPEDEPDDLLGVGGRERLLDEEDDVVPLG